MGNIAGFFSALPLDYFILGGIIVATTLDSLRSGVGRSCALAVALPVALLLYSLLDIALLIGDIGFLFSSTVAQAATFGVIVGISYLLVRRMGLEYIDAGMGQPIPSIVAGVAVTVVFLIVWLHMPALDSVWQFSPNIKAVFAEGFRLWWLLGAYVSLAFARG